MKRVLGVILVLPWLSSSAWSADEKALAVVEKAIKAMGGQERFDKAQTTYLKYNREFGVANGDPATTSLRCTAQGLENFRFALEMNAGGKHQTTTWIINGDQGWTQTGRGTIVMKPIELRVVKQSALEELLPTRPDLLKAKVFDLEWAGEPIVGDRPTAAIKVSGLGIVGMKVYFDRERGLPIKSEYIASYVNGDPMMQRIFSDYREFDGIQVATKIEWKREIAGDSDSWVDDVKEFKILDKVPPDTFTEPK
jgi:hypothetical protein